MSLIHIFLARMQPNNTINFMLVSTNLHGRLITMRPLKVMNDLNACSRLSGGAQNRIKFVQNYAEQCTVNLRSWMQEEAAKGMQFHSLHVDYWENGHRMLKTVPVLVRNAMTGNGGAPEDWQLVKRFAMIDILSGRNYEHLSRHQSDYFEGVAFNEEFKYVRYVKSLELKFRVHDHEKRPNRISVPLLVLEYGIHNATEDAADDKEIDVNFNFKITFTKRYSFDYLLEVKKIFLRIFMNFGDLNGFLLLIAGSSSNIHPPCIRNGNLPNCLLQNTPK